VGSRQGRRPLDAARVGAELAVDDEDRLLRAIRNGGQDTINDAGQQIVRRQLNVAPTLTIRPGFPVRVIVTRDLVLEPYRRLTMTKLKLGPIADDKPVKITVELPAALHRDLIAAGASERLYDVTSCPTGR
jgi:hypothetical protein